MTKKNKQRTGKVSADLSAQSTAIIGEDYTRPLEALDAIESAQANPRATALFLGVFFQELLRCGVSDFVVSPGSRSTGLAVVANQVAGRVYVHVDERSAAFFALGLAKATGNPVALICTSGTAPANWYPAVLEAQASRVPLLLLSADRPLRLRNLEAHQTTDQLELFGNHVKAFYEMPEPSSALETLRYARQVALDACIAAHGSMPGAQSCNAGPVHINFPLEEPLQPAPLQEVGLQLEEFTKRFHMPPTVVPGQVLLPQDAAGLLSKISGKRVVVLCGEGACNNETEARSLLDFAQMRKVPLLADPLSGLRGYISDYIIDHYDNVFGAGSIDAPEVLIRFGRWPVSKRATKALSASNACHIVVDMHNTRDATASATTLVRTTPAAFARGMAEATSPQAADGVYTLQWITANAEAEQRISAISSVPNKNNYEGAYVAKLVELAPAGSLLFSASSMAIRLLDTFYSKKANQLRVLCNRGLSGIDGTLSSAFGAAQAYQQTTVLTGDLAFLHDLGALSFGPELQAQAQYAQDKQPSIVVVVLNNNGGGIFNLLPQRSEEDYYQRLFVAPHSCGFQHAAQMFGLAYRNVHSVEEFAKVYQSLLGQPGIHVIEIPTSLEGLKERYEQF